MALILLPLRLIRGIKDRRLRWRLVFIFSTSSKHAFTQTNNNNNNLFLFYFCAVVTTIVSLVHAAFIISRGGIPVIISALVEDCMSLTVANLPVVATASWRRIDSSNGSGDDGDGQRWSTWKFKTRTLPSLSTTAAGGTGGGTYFSTALGTGRTTADLGTTTTELTGTGLEHSKGSVSIGMGAYSVGSVAHDDELFAKSVEGTGVRNEEKGGVVRIDVLPYNTRDQPPPKP